MVIEPIPIVGAGLLRDGPLRGGILERGAIHKENVESTVVVVVKKSDACTHGFWQIVLRGVGRQVIEVNPERRGDIDEFAGKVVLRLGN